MWCWQRIIFFRLFLVFDCSSFLAFFCCSLSQVLYNWILGVCLVLIMIFSNLYKFMHFYFSISFLLLYFLYEVHISFVWFNWVQITNFFFKVLEHKLCYDILFTAFKYFLVKYKFQPHIFIDMSKIDMTTSVVF